MKKLHKSLCIPLIIYAIFCTNVIMARRHHLEVKNDVRPFIALSTFGFYTDGRLNVKISNLIIDNESENDVFGLTLDKTTIDQMNPYLNSQQNKCLIEEPSSIQHNGQILFFNFDLKKSQVNVQCSPDWHNQNIYKNKETYYKYHDQRQVKAKVSDSSLFVLRRRRHENAPVDPAQYPDEESFNMLEEKEQEEEEVASAADKSTKKKEEVAAGEDKFPKQKEEEEIVAELADKLPKQKEEEEIVAELADKLAKQKEEAAQKDDLKSKETLENNHETIKENENKNEIPAKKVDENTQDKELPKKTEEKEDSIPDGNIKTAGALNNNNNIDNYPMHCPSFVLPLNKTIVNGKNVYSMSVSS